MSSSEKVNKKSRGFPVGETGKRELKKALKNASGVQVIKSFQQSHSLHAMVSLAFGTQPRYQAAAQTRSKGKETVETLDSDSVMEFLAHLGVSQHGVHKRISGLLLRQLEDEIRKTTDDVPLRALLSESWKYALIMAELRPIIWAILKQLGEKTPEAVLMALAERDEKGELKNEEIYRPLPDLLQKLVWEADWAERIPQEPDMDPANYLKTVSSTILYQTMYPYVEQYCSNKALVNSANRPFVGSIRDRRVMTSHRRAVKASRTSHAVGGAGSSIRGSAAFSKKEEPASSNAVNQLRMYLSESQGPSSIYRPRILYALLSILICQHGSQKEAFMGGANYLQCTLVSDILLSAGGPLPKTYDHVHSLAQALDDCVQEGIISDKSIIKAQKLIRLIFQPDSENVAESPTKKETEAEATPLTTMTKRQLNRIITDGILVMKEADPQQLFLNPVTDAIAPGYSKVIQTPMSISQMEAKVIKNQYNSVTDWEKDVTLMYFNCDKYNKGEGGAWFRGEARRQGKVFREEIFPQARNLYQNETRKRQQEAASNHKRPAETVPELTPLPASIKKRKKDTEDLSPSMPALASMLLADPYFTRIVVARVLKELRQGVVLGGSLPVAHRAIPSLLQFLHLARFSTKVCASRGKRFVVPGGGTAPADQPDNAIHFVPFATLRKNLPLLVRLLIEAELDKRIVAGEDLHDAAESTDSLKPPPIDPNLWVISDEMEVGVALMEGSLVVSPSHKTTIPIRHTPSFSLLLSFVTACLSAWQYPRICSGRDIFKVRLMSTATIIDATAPSNILSVFDISHFTTQVQT
jgi:hypothetical protein